MLPFLVFYLFIRLLDNFLSAHLWSYFANMVHFQSNNAPK
ncbi:hypothetical protein KUC_1425 [Vreelandella boliviensis LC1]|uniref:Uncharacterized protein n=1 Tax=Vreelandella boliviensis LC1 TaxID=1072583 RepID=A0A7U9C6S0_9GAMM|nr:hypothetical protein KUC_1425 [Halomonas boliviensis LC1]